MPNLRQERVRELLKRVIGEAIRREFHVAEVGLITVNDIDVGGDFKSAIVFISILGNAEQQKRGLQVMEQNRIRLQGIVAKSVILKYTPTLKFIVDDSIVRGNRVLQILDELNQAQASPAEGGPAKEP
jgi:ribosome-binding factor A